MNNDADLQPIGAREARSLVESGGAVLIDVRNDDEHAREHIPGARHMPLPRLTEGILRSEDRIAIYYCASGMRTRANVPLLIAAGPPSASALTGGLDAWKRAVGRTVIDRGRPIEIMRQVQIAAGSLVAAGVALSLTVSPWFAGLSAFVGTGLAVAGFTGFCGMARLLSRMPWNRPAAASPEAATTSRPRHQPHLT